MVAVVSYYGAVWCRSQDFHTLFELEPSGFRAIKPLFSELSLLHGSIKAVFANPGLGQVWVDDLKSPRHAVLRGPEGTYLAGQPLSAPGDLGEAVADWDYVYPDVSWLPTIQDALPNGFMVAHDRVRLTLKTAPSPSIALTCGFQLIAGEHFLETLIVYKDQVISRCTADMVVDGYAEFGIWTHPAHRGQGLAKRAASASIGQAMEAGVETVGWHCHASNSRSMKIAKSLGFVVTDRYLAFSASLPAENEGDLDTARCRELAAHFGAGASEMPWLDFHAAAGWAMAGEVDYALDAVERLVARGWDGRAEWLEEHWALRILSDHPRFQSAIRAQRNAK